MFAIDGRLKCLPNFDYSVLTLCFFFVLVRPVGGFPPLGSGSPLGAPSCSFSLSLRPFASSPPSGSPSWPGALSPLGFRGGRRYNYPIERERAEPVFYWLKPLFGELSSISNLTIRRPNLRLQKN